MSLGLSTLFEPGRVLALDAGDPVFAAGDPVQSMYLVVAGEIELVRHTPCGASLVLSRADPGCVLAEASVYATRYHCDGVARTKARLKSVPVAAFRDQLDGSPALARTWAAQLARALQQARMLSEIRSLKTVGQRLDAWIGEGRSLPPKGQIQDLARILSVSREALYRELARRRS